VLSDRFIDSTHAYQGATGGVDEELLDALDHLAVGGRGRTSPSSSTCAAVGLRRVALRLAATARRRPVRRRGHHPARAPQGAYLEIARREPERCVVIDAEPPKSTSRKTSGGWSRRGSCRDGVMADLTDLPRLDKIGDWPAPEQRADWLGDPRPSAH